MSLLRVYKNYKMHSRLLSRPAMQYSLIGIVVKIALYQNNRGPLVAGAGSQVAERADQVGKLTGRGAFRRHVANQAAALLHDTVGNGLLQIFTGQIRKIIVRQIFQFLPWGSLKAPSPYTMTSTCLPVAFSTLAWISSTRDWHWCGNSLTLSSVDLLEPSRPYFSL